jgi:hypothetical protein
VAVEQKLWNKRGGAKQGAGFYASSKSRGFFLMVSRPQKYSKTTNNACQEPVVANDNDRNWKSRSNNSDANNLTVGVAVVWKITLSKSN